REHSRARLGGEQRVVESAADATAPEVLADVELHELEVPRREPALSRTLPEPGGDEVVPPLTRAAAVPVCQSCEAAVVRPLDHRAEAVAVCVARQDLVQPLPGRLGPERPHFGSDGEEVVWTQ